MKGKHIFLLVAILLVLAGGGVGAYFIFRPKEDEPEQPQDKGAPVGGRVDGNTIFDSDLIDTSNLADKDAPTFVKDGDQKPNPVLASSPEGLAIIDRYTKALQANPRDMALIRARYDIGRTLSDPVRWDARAMAAIRAMFDQLDGVDGNNHQTYPIWGTWENGGGDLQAELKRFLSVYWKNYNYSPWRRFSNEHYLGSLQLNLMTGKRTNYVDPWSNFGIFGQVDRKGVDFFKALNTHHVPDNWLANREQGSTTLAYAAGGANKLARLMLDEIKELDRVSVLEATKQAVQDGLIVMSFGSHQGTNTNPSNGGKGGKFQH